ncbi:MAG: sigma-70 family RNA polymerase sigma factor [Niabella sp.]
MPGIFEVGWCTLIRIYLNYALQMTYGLLDYSQLLQRLKHHDQEAFNILYEHARKRLYVLAYSITNDEAASKDIIQDFFIDFWENKLFLNITKTLEGYLMFAIRNRALKYNQAQASLLKRTQSLPLPSNAKFLNRIEHKELKTEIFQAIGRLPPMAEKVFKMHYLDHLSHAQIAEQLHISKSTVSSHMDRALKELRIVLKNTEI